MIALFAVSLLIFGAGMGFVIISYHPTDDIRRKREILSHSFAGLELSLLAPYKLKSVAPAAVYASSYNSSKRIIP